MNTASTLILAVNPVAPPGADKIQTIAGWACYVLAAFCVMGMMAAGAFFGWEKMTEGSTRKASMALMGFMGGSVIMVSAALIFSTLTGFSVLG